MTELSGWKIVSAVFVLCAVTTIAASGQMLTTIARFNGANGAWPSGAPVQGTDGGLYFTTSTGGTDGSFGTVFKIAHGGRPILLYRFCSQQNCLDGFQPSTGLVLGTDGNLYGTTEFGGAGANCGLEGTCGTLFKITPTGMLTTLYSFCLVSTCPSGAIPTGVTQGTDGNFYGTTYSGGPSDYGTVFKLTSGDTLTTLHSFDVGEGVVNEGVHPGGLVEDAGGSFDGVTVNGGLMTCDAPWGCGTVFKMTSQGSLSTLHTFDGADGFIAGGLVQATDGNLYGITADGGATNDGTIFKIASGGSLITLYTFCAQPNCADGTNPAGLTQASDGNFYGTTESGGNVACNPPGGCGTVFEITPRGTLVTLYSFCAQPNCTDGAFPSGPLLQATDGDFYGATTRGGTGGLWGAGTVFRLSVGLGPFLKLERYSGRVGQTGGILGQGFTGTTSVLLNGTPSGFTVVSDTFLKATVPAGATSGFVTVTTPGGTLTSDKPFTVTH